MEKPGVRTLSIPARDTRTDGNFHVPHAGTPMTFTGERMTSAAEGQIEFEHYHRYCVARDLCDGRDVLDVASGEGYGAALLAGIAASVVGVEIDHSSVSHAQASYRLPNLRFMQGDALAIPLPDASVDVVVCFETLEHVPDQARFISEARRVLRPGGLFVVSTPDRAVYSAPGSDPNPYHVLELTDPEFRVLLATHFAHSCVLAQRPVLGSMLAAERSQDWRSYERRGPDIIEASHKLARAHYLVAVATDGALPEVPSSVYLDRRRVHDVMQDVLRLPMVEGQMAATEGRAAALARQAAELTSERDAGRVAAARSNQALADAQDRVDAAERDRTATKLRLSATKAELTRLAFDLKTAYSEVTYAAQAQAHAQERQREAEYNRVAAEEAADQARQAADQARQAADAIIFSTSWALLAPIRIVGHRIPRLTRVVRQVVKATWWTVTLQIGHRYGLWRRHRAAMAAAVPTPQIDAPPPTPDEPASMDPGPGEVLSLPKVPSLREAFVTLYGHVPIHFPPVSAPVVSVIIPAYRGFPDLENCLRSLALHRATEPSFEVILIDDCPAEPVGWAVPDSGGLIKVANPENIGFLLTCNRGARMARGDFLCFLNSDTIVSAGWLRTLIEALRETPGAVLAGGMLLCDDGTIQEAGWRILANGWGYPVGRGGSPRDGAYTYRRPVDCVTGSCFVMPRPVFERLDGFDTLYAPAFYEEFDLAFRARARGLQAVYEPRSHVVHLGSASYGSERRDQLSSINQASFVRRFAGVLVKHPWNTGDEFVLRHAAGEGPVLLVVDYGVPQPDRHAGDVTMGSYLSMLATAGWRVVFGPMDGRADGPGAEALERQGIELIRAPRTIKGWLRDHGTHVRHVWLARPEIAEQLIGPVRLCTNAHIAYYTHDLHHVRLRQSAELHADAEALAEAARVQAQEVAVFRAVDHVMAPSEAEAEIILRLAPGTRLTVLPPYHYDAADIRTHDAGHFTALTDIVFVGGFPHIPNVDAALFMAGQVMPLVWRERPEARLVLVGYAPPPEVQALAGPRIAVTGQVPATEPFLARARVMLAALRYGAGVKGKTVEALRLGVPVVTTPVGAEGVGITPEQDAIVADGAAALADAVLALLRDPERCAALSAAGAALVRRRFSRAAARSAIGRVFQTPRCGICGSGHLIAPPPDDSFREAFVCHNCFALGRVEALGRVLLGRLARDGETSMAELARRRSDLGIHEFGFVGGLADTMRTRSWYTVSDFFDGVPLGAAGPEGVRCEDLTRLTFADDSFDLVVSQDVMEHVPDPARGFAETARVLRPRGSHIFTTPQKPGRAHSVTRARLGSNGNEHLLPPEHHGDPVRAEGALVYTDFGEDLREMIEKAGLRLIVHDVPVLGGTSQQTIRVFEAVKPAGPP